MQTNPFYIYDNKIDVQITFDPLTPQRYKPVYARTIKVYKGVDNQLKFVCKNSDQKAQNLTGKTVQFNLLDDNTGSVYFTVDCDTTNANVGILTATISEKNLIDLTKISYNYSLMVTDQNDQSYVTYTDDAFNVRGQIEVLSGHYPEFKPSVNVTIPTIYYANLHPIVSSTVQSDLPTHRNNLHTSQFYFDNFTGNVQVQATMDNVLPSGNTSPSSYFTVSTLDYADKNGTDYHNFQGAYSFVRFVINRQPTTSGNVTTILYRS